ncbi:GNAT family N-acetyltransferase [Paracoccus aurantiacus]|uniref:GNAT family N-acetyltransferase n=1 Tax=Paracoccus aurantiacus TaxID=2599412 RepID=A0A5C6S9J7_9RHOB|nr:GNAT family N-acetyltransferase [Paracoccus aurantiacus]TXB71054.1 GNAT family N-acetyltransferase [Paracoccus aurantiacus]
MTTLTIDIPVLETERLFLREPRLSDLDAIVAFGMSDRTEFVGGKLEPWQSWNVLNAAIGHWINRGFGWWVLEDKATGAVAGRAGIGYHLDWPEPELGWHIYDGFEGKGLAYEAALAARDHANRHFGLGPLISLIAHGNTRSRRLAERLGAKIETEDFQIRGTPCMIYRHPQVAV